MLPSRGQGERRGEGVILALAPLAEARGYTDKRFSSCTSRGSNVVVLDPDVAKAFPDSVSVNEALRSLLDFTRATTRLTNCSAKRAKKSSVG